MGSSYSRVQVRKYVDNKALYGVTNGTAAANKAVVCDGSTNVTGLTLTSPTVTGGTITGATITGAIAANVKAGTAQVDVTSSTTPVTITGLSLPLVAGATYAIEAYIPTTSGASGGVKVTFDTADTLTLTSASLSAAAFNGTTVNANTTTTTATMATSIVATTAVNTYVLINGTIVVNAAGTFVLKGAQNASNGTTTSFLVNSFLRATRIS